MFNYKINNGNSFKTMDTIEFDDYLGRFKPTFFLRKRKQMYFIKLHFCNCNVIVYRKLRRLK